MLLQLTLGYFSFVELTLGYFSLFYVEPQKKNIIN